MKLKPFSVLLSLAAITAGCCCCHTCTCGDNRYFPDDPVPVAPAEKVALFNKESKMPLAITSFLWMLIYPLI